jgi:hypothetical protein
MHSECTRVVRDNWLTTDRGALRFSPERPAPGRSELDYHLPLYLNYTMALKLSARQQAQLAFLQTLPPKFQRIHNIVEQLSTLRADESLLRNLGRLLDEIKGNAAALSLTGITETAGIMGTMLRRGGGVQLKVRGLRELLGSLKTNCDGALRSATTPEEEAPE